MISELRCVKLLLITSVDQSGIIRRAHFNYLKMSRVLILLCLLSLGLCAGQITSVSSNGYFMNTTTMIYSKCLFALTINSNAVTASANAGDIGLWLLLQSTSTPATNDTGIFCAISSTGGVNVFTQNCSTIIVSSGEQAVFANNVIGNGTSLTTGTSTSV